MRMSVYTRVCIRTNIPSDAYCSFATVVVIKNAIGLSSMFLRALSTWSLVIQ